MARKIDKHLLDALTKTYIARAQLIHKGVQASKIDLLMAEIDDIEGKSLDWREGGLGVTKSAMKKVLDAGGCLHQVFAHPDVLSTRPHLIAYYRNIVTISKKGIGQILFATQRFESGHKTAMPRDDAKAMAAILNRIVSGVIDSMEDYSVGLSRQAVLAEIGAQLQGTYNNMIGKRAAKAVRSLLHEYVCGEGIGTCSTGGPIELTNGWRIIFGSEPDVAFYDRGGLKQIAIEIKGSLDISGVQTRYGEAKKSFAKQIAENTRCHTIYLASCYTDAVIEQIQRDGQVREWFNLTSILYDETEKKRFLGRLFHIVSAPR